MNIISSKSKIDRNSKLSIRVNNRLLANALSKLNSDKFFKYTMNIDMNKMFNSSDLIEMLLVLACDGNVNYMKYKDSFYKFLGETSPEQLIKDYEKKIKDLDYKITKTYGIAQQKLIEEKKIYIHLLNKQKQEIKPKIKLNKK